MSFALPLHPIQRIPKVIELSNPRVPLKGLTDLIAVWPPVLSRSGDKATLVVCGDGPQRSERERAGAESSPLFARALEDSPQETVRYVQRPAEGSA